MLINIIGAIIVSVASVAVLAFIGAVCEYKENNSNPKLPEIIELLLAEIAARPMDWSITGAKYSTTTIWSSPCGKVQLTEFCLKTPEVTLEVDKEHRDHVRTRLQKALNARLVAQYAMGVL